MSFSEALDFSEREAGMVLVCRWKVFCVGGGVGGGRLSSCLFKVIKQRYDETKVVLSLTFVCHCRLVSFVVKVDNHRLIILCWRKCHPLSMAFCRIRCVACVGDVGCGTVEAQGGGCWCRSETFVRKGQSQLIAVQSVCSTFGLCLDLVPATCVHGNIL